MLGMAIPGDTPDEYPQEPHAWICETCADGRPVCDEPCDLALQAIAEAEAEEIAWVHAKEAASS